jgi:hypothetical protein
MTKCQIRTLNRIFQFIHIIQKKYSEIVDLIKLVRELGIDFLKYKTKKRLPRKFKERGISNSKNEYWM